MVYVAAGDGGFRVVDVSSPTSPRIIGAVGTPTRALGVAVAGNYAYVAASTSVQVINVTTPSRPVIVSSLTTPGIAAAVAGSRLYVVDGVGLKTFDLSNAAAPLLLSTMSNHADYVAASGTLVFLGARALDHSDLTGGLYVLDVSLATAPRMLGHLTVPGTVGDIAWSSKLYAADTAGMVDVVSLGVGYLAAGHGTRALGGPGGKHVMIPGVVVVDAGRSR